MNKAQMCDKLSKNKKGLELVEKSIDLTDGGLAVSTWDDLLQGYNMIEGDNDGLGRLGRAKRAYLKIIKSEIEMANAVLINKIGEVSK